MSMYGRTLWADRKTGKVVAPWAAAATAVLLLVAGCGSDTEPAPDGLARSEVAEMVESAVAAMEQPGLTAAEVSEMVESAVAAMEQPGLTAAEVSEMVESAISEVEQPGLTAAEVSEMIESAIDQAASAPPPAEVIMIGAAPPRSSPVEYTKYFVESAIARYDATGLSATTDYYNREESVDGQWYLFIIGPDDTVLSHYDPSLLGEDIRGSVGTDANGHEFWRDMVTATEDGKWLAYVWQNPASGAGYVSGEFGEAELKNSWVVRHDGLLFGTGWYIDADDFMKSFVGAAVDAFADGGVQGVIDYFSSDELVYSGLASASGYYSSNFGWEGLAFTAGPDGTILLHTEPVMIGRHIEEVFGDIEVTASSEGNWVTAEGIDTSTGEPLSVNVWVVGYEGTIIGAGWRDVGAN